MKKFTGFLFVFNLCINSLFAQDTINNFKVEQDEIVWQKVFDTQLSFDSVISHFEEQGILESISIVNDKIIGGLKPFEADYKGAGYSRMSSPIYIVSYLFTGHVVIEFKDNRYRVTVRKIFLEKIYNDGLSESGQKETLNTFAVKKGKNSISNLFKREASKILDYTFNKLFTIMEKQEDNW